MGGLDVFSIANVTFSVQPVANGPASTKGSHHATDRSCVLGRMSSVQHVYVFVDTFKDTVKCNTFFYICFGDEVRHRKAYLRCFHIDAGFHMC